jgi:ABC-type multidrug transport system fused ATPase/permease subunit
VKYSAGEYGRIVFGILLMFGMSAATLLQPWPLKLVLDLVLAPKSPSGALAALLERTNLTFLPLDPVLAALTLLCFSIVVIQLVTSALNVWSTQELVAIGLRMVFKLRCAIFDHVQRLSLTFHDSTTVGDSLYRIAWDAYSVQTIFNQGVVPTITAIVTLAGIVAVMLTRDWSLTLAALSVAVPLLVIISRFERHMAARAAQVCERESDVTTRVQATLSGIRAVQAFGREEYENDRFRIYAEASAQASLKLTLIQTGAQFAINVVLACGSAVVIWLAAWRTLQGRLSPGDVVLMASYMTMLYKPIEALANSAAGVQQASAGAMRVFQLFDSISDVRESRDARRLPGRSKGEIRFEHVSFAYPNRRPVLSNLSLDVPAGSSLALVGPSGAGKTTLASLLLRLYDISSGRITVDGADIRGLTLKSLRSNVGLMSQQSILFGATVRENIAYGKPDATFEEIRRAARASGADQFIWALPHQYDTQIGEHGWLLSGGQRQRISLARAFLKDAPILILDEPTVGLDAETENALMESLNRLMHARTTIIVAHNLSTVRHVDQIAVLKEGFLVEVGSHSKLLAKGGLYAEMCRLQRNMAEETIA